MTGRIIIVLVLFTACANPGTRRIYDVRPRGTIDLGGSTSSILPAIRCATKTGDFGAAYWLGSFAATVQQIWTGPSRGAMAIRLADRSTIGASRVITEDRRWWGFWDQGGSTIVVDLHCAATCAVTMSVIRREHGPDRFAAACFERWVGGAEEIEVAGGRTR